MFLSWHKFDVLLQSCYGFRLFMSMNAMCTDLFSVIEVLSNINGHPGRAATVVIQQLAGNQTNIQIIQKPVKPAFIPLNNSLNVFYLCTS